MSQIVKILSNESIVDKNEQNEVEKVKVETYAEYNGNSIVGIGVSKVHPVDKDLSTEAVGTRIAFLRSIQSINQKVKDEYPVTEKFKKELDLSIADLQDEIDRLIKDKEFLFQKIRKNRSGDMSDKVRVAHISGEGKVDYLDE